MPHRPARRRLVPLVLTVLLLAPALVLALRPGVVRAQASVTPAASAPATPSVDDMKRLVGTLQDPTARARLVADLNALIAAQERRADAAPATPSDWLTRALGQISAGAAAIATEATDTAQLARDGPRLRRWLSAILDDPARRAELLGFLARLAIVLAGASLAELLVARLVAQPRRALETGAPERPLGRALLLAGRVLLALVPIGAFVGTATLLLPLTSSDRTTRLAVVALVNANVIARAVLAVGRRVLLPERPPASRAHRLMHLSDAAARFAYAWLRRLTWLGVYGFAVVEIATIAGLPPTVRALLLRLVGLALTVLAVALVIRCRRAVARRIAGAAPTEGTGTAVEWRRARHRLAAVWHVLAIAYLVGAYLVWALAIRDGFATLLRGTLWSAATLALLRLGLILVDRLAARAVAAAGKGGGARRLPGYLPVAWQALRLALIGLALLGLAQAWGADVAGWLQSAAGRRILGGALSIVLILAVAIAAWEIAALAIARWLAAGAATAGNTRLRTLLPLLRNALSVLITVMTGLVVLSELGLNIAPLLAGAGVAGLAIGFGAQTLVKDVITGLFMLLEDAVSIGDLVDVGGRSGVVEGLSIRSMRLRDFDGSVHTVPFSAVAAIKNMTRDYSYYVMDVLVDYRSNLERAIGILQAIGAELQADADYRALILEPLHVHGVDRFADNAVVVRCRIKTLPTQRWAVGRELNRRIKLAFDAAGIGMVAAVPPPAPEPPAGPHSVAAA